MTDLSFSNPRYRLLEAIGEGGMGVVYRAMDRLTGATVALKRVTAIHKVRALFQPIPDQNEDVLRLALAREFQTLASLRHPNIISVLDYGFDTAHQPFYTMRYLPAAQTLLEAGSGRSLDEQLTLIEQLLQALAYLHRRGILHRDLKPENILVSEGVVRVLDFGLAASRSMGEGGGESTGGTAFYTAPEIWEGEPYSVASDLFAVGLIVSQLLTGQHPFGPLDNFFIDRVLDAEPDLGQLDGLLAQVLHGLLAKEPAQRFQKPEAALAALVNATGRAQPAETSALRESFLQAATFVGRKTELSQLTAALTQAAEGQGAAWLIGGESGVGKSRLLNELRIQALVSGFQVLRGQAVQGGGLPYQLWREPLRHLALSTPLSELEAGVLKPLVPDMAALLEREIPDPPSLSGADYVKRLVRVVVEVLHRQTQPLLLLLEDLHWADESLTLLSNIIHVLVNRPILIIGNYRDDERPHLPKELPGMIALPLARLSSDSVAELSIAMLGEAGRQPEVLALLERETEGNSFFMVEVVRALAESSGHLGEIGHGPLPAQVFAGGVQQLVQRRLQRVPAADYALLQLAAVLGRQIDLQAVHTIISEAEVERWLLACAEARVLEVQGEQWRFAHDKLREGLLASLAPDQKISLHQQAALAIERAYTAELASHAARLAEHYRQAGDGVRERQYARQAGDYAATTFVHTEAIRHYTRALELTEDARAQFELLKAREEVYNWRGNRETQAADLQALTDLVEQLNDDGLRMEVYLRRARQAQMMGDFAAVVTHAERALALAQALKNIEAETTARLRWGMALHRQSLLPAARAQLNLALALARSAQLKGHEVDCLASLGTVINLEGDADTARTLMLEALELSRAMGDREREARATNSLGVIASHSSDDVEEFYFEETLRLNRLIGRPDGECVGLLNLGISANSKGQYERAETLYSQALQLARLTQNAVYECYALNDWGILAQELGDFPMAHQCLNQALKQARQLGMREIENQTLRRLSSLALALDDPILAEQHARAALQIAQEGKLALAQRTAWVVLGRALLRQGNYAGATQAFQATVDLIGEQRAKPSLVDAWIGLTQTNLAQGQLAVAYDYANQILAWLKTYSPYGVSDLVDAYSTCYRALASQADDRAAEILELGLQVLESRAANLTDPAKRQAYLENVRPNRELLAAKENAMLD